jgi:hypothetical protein
VILFVDAAELKCSCQLASLDDKWLLSTNALLCACQVRKDHWKGMSAAQREAIAQEQLGQVLARRAAAAQAAAEEAAAAAEQHRIHKAVMQQVSGV